MHVREAGSAMEEVLIQIRVKQGTDTKEYQNNRK